ncbi:MAG: toll/interleukin-1 receptor domain-containing protein [Pseudomonadota bacterium]
MTSTGKRLRPPAWAVWQRWKLSGGLKTKRLRKSCKRRNNRILSVPVFSLPLQAAPNSPAMSVGQLLIVAIIIVLILVFSRRRNRRSSTSHLKAAPSGDRQITNDISPDIFISYRRDDTADVCGRLYDRLAQEFGRERVFKDVDPMRPGFDFRMAIEKSLADCRVALVLIGPDWRGTSDTEQTERLNNPNDYVRLEVRLLLGKGIPVIPIFVGSSQSTDLHDLPEDISSLAHRQGIPLRPDPDFKNDVARIQTAIERAIEY